MATKKKKVQVMKGVSSRTIRVESYINCTEEDFTKGKEALLKSAGPHKA